MMTQPTMTREEVSACIDREFPQIHSMIEHIQSKAQRDLIGRRTPFKPGRALAVGEVVIRSDQSEDIVCHATGTYAIPRPKS